jgi:iron(III) transport system substrate-binding protein
MSHAIPLHRALVPMLRLLGRAAMLLGPVLCAAPVPARAADTLNVYTAWPESLSQPIFKAYTAKTGVPINFIRLSTGELVARATAEKNNPRADVIWGAPGDGFAAAKAAGILEPYKPAAWDRIAPELRDPEAYYVAVSKNTLVFMSNAKLLKEKGLKPPVSWNDLLDPAYKGQIQTADARTSGTALTRILSIYYALGRDEDRTLAYQKQLHKNVQVYTKSGGGCTIPTALGQAMVCIAHMPDAMEAKKKGYDMVITFPREGVAAVIEAVALVKGAKNREAATRFIDWTFSKDMQDLLDKNEVYMLPTLPDGSINPAVQALMKEAKLLPVDLDWVGKNRKRLVDRWVNEVITD